MHINMILFIICNIQLLSNVITVFLLPARRPCCYHFVSPAGAADHRQAVEHSGTPVNGQAVKPQWMMCNNITQPRRGGRPQAGGEAQRNPCLWSVAPAGLGIGAGVLFAGCYD